MDNFFEFDIDDLPIWASFTSDSTSNTQKLELNVVLNDFGQQNLLNHKNFLKIKGETDEDYYNEFEIIVFKCEAGCAKCM